MITSGFSNSVIDRYASGGCVRLACAIHAKTSNPIIVVAADPKAHAIVHAGVAVTKHGQMVGVVDVEGVHSMREFERKWGQAHDPTTLRMTAFVSPQPSWELHGTSGQMEQNASAESIQLIRDRIKNMTADAEKIACMLVGLSDYARDAIDEAV